MRNMLGIIVLILASWLALPAQANGALDYDQYPAEVFTGRPAPLVWDEAVFPQGMAFEYTSYQEMLTQSWRRFAGHYMVVDVMCASPERCGVMVDLKTGHIHRLPGMHYWFDYKADSRLLITNVPDEEMLAQPDVYPDRRTYYYLWDGTDFTLEQTVAWPELPPKVTSTVPDAVEFDLIDVPLPTMRPDPATTGAID